MIEQTGRQVGRRSLPRCLNDNSPWG